MKGREGRAWARNIVENPDKLHFITFDQEYPQIDVPGDRMASFSSRGPNSDDLLGIKPMYPLQVSTSCPLGRNTESSIRMPPMPKLTIAATVQVWRPGM